MTKSIIYRFDNFLFYPEKNLLIKDHNEVTLNETINKIMILFCTSHGNVITRDEIASYCWENRIVTDDSIRQAIKKLRLFLNERPDNTYIETIRGKGYKFIVDVHEGERPAQEIDILKTPNKFKKLLKPFALTSSIVVVLFVVVNAYGNFSSFGNRDLSIVNISRVTFERGNEYEYSTADNNNDSYVVLHENSPIGKKIIIRNDQKKVLKELYPTDEEGYVLNPSFNNQGDRLLFLNYSKKKCYISMYEIISDETKDIIPCTKTDGSIAIDWLSNHEILFSSSSSLYEPLRLKKFDLYTNSISYISNPTPGGRGDFLVKSCKESKILSIRDINWKDHNVYLREGINERVLNGIQGNAISLDWTNDCNFFFYNNTFGELYLYDLVKQSSKKINIDIPTDSSIEYNDYAIYVSGNITYSSTISFIDIDSKEREDKFVSSGQVSNLVRHHSSAQYAFISNRTGKDQIWVSNDNINNATQVTFLSDNNIIAKAQWDFFENTIYYSVEKNLYAINLETKETSLLFRATTPIRSFHVNNSNLLYTHYDLGKWEVVHRDLITKKEVFPSRLEISHIKTSESGEIYLSDRTGDIYQYIDIGNLIKIYDSTGDLNDWAISNDTIYLHDDHDIYSISRSDSSNKPVFVVNIPEGIFGQISIADNQIYVHKVLTSDTYISKYKLKL